MHNLSMHNLSIGLDLGGTKIEAIVLSSNGETILRERIPTPSKNDFQTPDQQYHAIILAIKTLISASEDTLNYRFNKIGIGIPGAISPTTGLVKNANTTCLIGRAFRQDLEASFKQAKTFIIANDADCFVVSEAKDGAAKNFKSVFGVIIGTGCGGGLVINQQLITGPNAITGEWGHNPLPWLDPSDELTPCYCGKLGCIETFLSGPGFSHHAHQAHSPDSKVEPKSEEALSPQQWHKKLLAKDSEAIKVFDAYARRLAKSLASVINIIDPEVIVLGGGMSNIDYLYQRVPELLIEYVFSDEVLTRLVKAEFGDSSGVRGAARLV
jgi:fructokinase